MGIPIALLKRAVSRVRALCGAWPGVIETKTFGHPTFQTSKKRTFAVLDDHEQVDMLCLVLKIDPKRQGELVDGATFFKSKFGAKHGWTAMKVDAKTDWTLAGELVADSYQRVAPKTRTTGTTARKVRKSR